MKKAMFLLGAVLLLVVTGWGLQQYLTIDTCLDKGGTWNDETQQCIRPFEQGIAFTRSDHNSAEPQTAYVYLSENLQQAEVFFAMTDKPIILQAVTVTEGDTTPVLYKNDIEQIDIINVKEIFYLRYQHQAIYSANTFSRNLTSN
ncbi:hypothetical protein KO533_05005 [Shewanella sp. NKUCC05_KAH]|uniref:hypothetical protein n=1 Tax=Shewanella sp. NKUCC05_KAH TaxID=2842126 RepID=UPI001C5BE5E9|nr:hypothetical protein [Shewanella sp. NKUCC05_KAH]MBW3525928.1 hypothetical protein [Shewanella sp. NKUCC05_KAH]